MYKDTKLKMSEDIILIKRYDKNGDQNALNELYEKYTKIGERHARIYFANRNYDKYIADDYMGEIDLVFINSITKFNRKSTAFRAYFIAILDNSLNKYVGRVLQSNDALRHYVPLDLSIDDGTTLYDLIEDKTIDSSLNISQMLDTAARISSLEASLSRRKTNLTKAVVILKAQGYSLREISDLLEVSESTLSRIYYQFRKSINIR